jgi:predicted acylesterase/phospholipase RssA
VAFPLHSSEIDDILGINESLAVLDVLACRRVGERIGRGVAKMAIGIVLGGGAPNLTLMTGALLALDEAGVDFKVITTTGAGMVVGLLYAAPRKKDSSVPWEDARKAALKETRDWGIDDLIYDMIPVNYKIFQKPGVLAEAFSQATNPSLWSIPRKTRRQRLLGDTLSLAASAMSPSDLKSSSQGLCQPPPWIEMLVNFDDLKTNLSEGDKMFRLSAYCIEDSDEKTFHKEEITAEHFKAALAMPFIYAPYKLKDSDGTWKTYLEGSAFKTLQLNPEKVMLDNNVDMVIFFDIMGNRNLIGEPRWLIDAWGKSIVAPLTRLAEQGLENFKMERELQKKDREIKRLDELIELAQTNPEFVKDAHNLHKKTRDFNKLAEILGLADQDFELFKQRRDQYMRGCEFDELVENLGLKKEALDPLRRRRNTYVKGREFDELAKVLKLAEQYCDQFVLKRDDYRKRPDVQELNKLMNLAEKNIKLFQDERTAYMSRLVQERDLLREAISKENKPHHEFTHTHRVELLRMRFRDHIPDEQWPKVLDWSHSNMSELFKVGVKTGREFVKTHRERLEESMGHGAKLKIIEDE